MCIRDSIGPAGRFWHGRIHHVPVGSWRNTGRMDAQKISGGSGAQHVFERQPGLAFPEWTGDFDLSLIHILEILIGIGALESSELQTEENPDQAEQLPGARGKSIVATVLLLLLVALVVFSVDGIMTVVKQLFGIS